MTEHERRVNDGDIIAYENNDNKTLNAKIPGFSVGETVQERYISKQFRPETLRASQQKQRETQSPQQNQIFSPNRKQQQHPFINEQLNGSGQAKVDLDEVKRNMENPEALRFRGNTGNKQYGFEQGVQKP